MLDNPSLDVITVFTPGASGGVTNGLLFAVTGSAIAGTVTLQQCLNLAQSIAFEFRPVSGGLSLKRTVQLSASGEFSINTVPHGRYNIAVKGSKWLQKIVPVDFSSGSVSGLNISLKAGDANNDNRVDVTDLLVLIGAYNQVSPAERYSFASDFNEDGANDISDLLLIIFNYNRQGDS